MSYIDKKLGYIYYPLTVLQHWARILETIYSNSDPMKDKFYDNADSFAMSFDEEWKNIDCEDSRLKIEKVFEHLSDHPFVVSNPENARNLAEFRIFTLKKFQ